MIRIAERWHPEHAAWSARCTWRCAGLASSVPHGTVCLTQVHLVIAAASSVQLAAHAADQLAEPPLIGCVDVLIALLYLLRQDDARLGSVLTLSQGARTTRSSSTLPQHPSQ